MEREIMMMKALEHLYTAYAIMSDLEDAYQLETDELEDSMHGLGISIEKAEERYERMPDDCNGCILDFLYKSMEVTAEMHDEKRAKAESYTTCCVNINAAIEELRRG